MIDLYVLKQFVSYAECGTLSEAAESLHLTQPALSRNMKKLEEDLGVLLFDRQRNRISLNKTGEFFLEEAKRILKEAEQLVNNVREFDFKNKTLSIGICAPGPAWKYLPVISSLYPHMSIRTSQDAEENLYRDLEAGYYQLIFVHEKPADSKYCYRECGKEKLMFSLPKKHRFARRKSISFAEMNGENMLMMNDVGFWDFVRTEKMPDSRFLIQDDRYSFNELVTASLLPSFSSDLAEKYIETADNRVNVSISDSEAEVTYYMVCLQTGKNEFLRLFQTI